MLIYNTLSLLKKTTVINNKIIIKNKLNLLIFGNHHSHINLKTNLNFPLYHQVRPQMYL